MRTSKSSTLNLKNVLPVGLMFTVSLNQGVNAAQVDTEAHIAEIASLVQSALQQTSSAMGTHADLGSLSESQINS